MESTKKESLFLYLYDSYVDDLYAYGKALGVLHEDLQDIIHDVFLHIMDHYTGLNICDNKQVKFYLLKCLKNKVVSNARKNMEIYNIENLNDSDFPIYVTGLDLLINKEERTKLMNRIEKMLQCLTPRQREAIYLRYMQELSYEEIAEMLHITEKGSRKLVSRAMIELKNVKLLPRYMHL